MIRRFARKAGFTIIEILIAIVVLVLGISGILALFPTAIESGNQTVEDTYTATITQSVVDAISVGLRESRYQWTDSTGRVWTYFLFNHDGVVDAPVSFPEDLARAGTDGDIWTKDYCIILPQLIYVHANHRGTLTIEECGQSTHSSLNKVFDVLRRRSAQEPSRQLWI